ncbi:hypothetical protein PSTG_09013 [Puccinia striiformis f. sp. tritici PST-78]|uniref:Uncharacterized protein n=1 Tax=Puccinia striiformis f. sp. tritici PST-78 TaxID=1165861 RepID=A0A0L0VFK1_9BASI|nr:hypothetical protein PSTG_09013 [Puccinia striiformis f. sp. tritici PST-78]
MAPGVFPDPQKLGGTSWDPPCKLEKLQLVGRLCRRAVATSLLQLVGEAFRRAVATSARRKALLTSWRSYSSSAKLPDELQLIQLVGEAFRRAPDHPARRRSFPTSSSSSGLSVKLSDELK